jgi:hypothetical protein
MVWTLTTATLFLIFLLLFAAFNRLLREDHPDVYRELGSPSLIPKDVRQVDWRTTKFLWSGAYRRVADKRLTRVGLLLQLYVVLFALWVFWPLLV